MAVGTLSNLDTQWPDVAVEDVFLDPVEINAVIFDKDPNQEACICGQRNEKSYIRCCRSLWYTT